MGPRRWWEVPTMYLIITKYRRLLPAGRKCSQMIILVIYVLRNIVVRKNTQRIFISSTFLMSADIE